jgi:leucyl-tRNA synthetase
MAMIAMCDHGGRNQGCADTLAPLHLSIAGSYAVNPANGELIPIWVADYVLGTYGSGCIMAVPAHDTRDFEFAEQFGLPVVRVMEGGELPFTRAGTAVNSASTATGLDIDGKSMEEALPAVLQWLEARNLGTRQVNYKLRDWLFARHATGGSRFR